jgi:hypothetical protein
MDFDRKSINWSKDVEQYFKAIGERSLCLSWMHKRSEQHFSVKATYVDIPVIILSTMSGSLSLSSSSIFGDEWAREASILCGLISIFVSIINTIASYFSYSRKAEASKACYIQYDKIARFIALELSLPTDERMNAADMLKVVNKDFDRLNEIGSFLPSGVISAFKKSFGKRTDICKPEIANGIEEIEVFSESRDITVQVDPPAKKMVKAVIDTGKENAMKKIFKGKGKE